MPRIPAKEMEKRVNVLQDILEEHTDGLSINELVVALKEKGVELPKSEYQAVSVVLKKAEGSVAIKKGNKWKLLEEEE